jgi:hypothetical protein
MRRALVCCVASLAACGGGAAPGPSSSAHPTPPAARADVGPAASIDAGPSAPAASTLDEGVFRIAVAGAPIGEEAFRLTALGDVRVIAVDSRLNVGGQALAQRGELETDAAWRPRRLAMDVDLGGKTMHARAALDGDTLVETIELPAGPQVTRATAPVDLFVQSYVVAHLAPLCALAGEPKNLVAFPGTPISVGAARRLLVDDPLVAAGGARAIDVVDVSLSVNAQTTIVCDGERLVGVAASGAGLTATRVGDEALAAPVTAPAPVVEPVPKTLAELPRAVAAPDGQKLACTLTLPRTHAALKKRPAAKAKVHPLPAVVLLSTWGAQDRDGNSPGPGGVKLALARQLALDLAGAGIASWRCDDRGVGQSTGALADATLDGLAADAGAMLAALRAEPAVDPRRVGLVGHGEGGEVAVMVALADPAVHALALLAAPGRAFAALVVDQWRAAWARARVIGTAEIAARVRRLGDLPDERAAFDSPLVRSHLAHDPAAAAGKLGAVAVLLAQGGTDAVALPADSEALDDALVAAKQPRVRYEIYPELDHWFCAAAAGDAWSAFDPDAVVDAAARRDLREFLAANL